jgi:hypothetical protein
VIALVDKSGKIIAQNRGRVKEKGYRGRKQV